ncbi:MAG: hypothetical protein NC033_02390 [Clostridiales bacterium]|nr:hypothetical protein [Clostridiales bacterium]
MHRHSFKTPRTFKSKTEKTVIIGGNDDFCAERYGYKREINGIAPLPYFKRLSPSITCANLVRVEYAPFCDRVILMSGTGSLYGWDTISRTSTVSYGSVTSGSYPRVHCYVSEGNNYYSVIGGSTAINIAVNSTVKRANFSSNKVTDTVLHCGRIFGIDATDGYILRWSGYTFSDWTTGVDNAGYVKFNAALGKLLNLFVLGEKIVIVREYGITVLSVLGDARHMRTEVCDRFRIPRVVPDTSVICGGLLWIYTKNGMYVFDGSSVTEKPFDEIMRGYELSTPYVFDERYIHYTATKDGTNYLFVYDTAMGACSPYAKGCRCPFFIGDEPFCFNGNYVFTLLFTVDDPARVWLSKPFVCGVGKVRTLKSLTAEGSGKFKVEVDCDGRKLEVSGAGKYSFAEVGHSFTFKVTGNGSVTGLTAEWEVVE